MSDQVKTRPLCLVVSSGDQLVRRVPLSRERLTLGRRPYNDLVLDDLTVSGEHALVSLGPDGILLRDLNSRNGTLVDGRAISECVVEPGSRIEIGIYRLEFEADSTDGPDAMHAEVDGVHAETSSVRAETSSVRAEAGSVRAAAVEAGEARTPLACVEASLEYQTGAFAGVRQRLDRSITRITDGGAQVAVISRRKSGYFLTHLEGPDTPRVNGESLGHAGRRLADGDHLELGASLIRIVLRG